MTGVAVYLKYPTPGKVKTRLAASIGAEQAAVYYRKMINLVWDRALKPLPTQTYQVSFWCDPYRPLTDYETLFGNWGKCFLQEGADLGERLRNSFAYLLKEHDSVITIGTDCIDITPSLLEQSRSQLLQQCDLVLGPATDGGYYLIGLKKEQPSLFTGIEWSTSSVFESTVEKANQLGLRIDSLVSLSDIDTVEDLKSRNDFG